MDSSNAHGIRMAPGSTHGGRFPSVRLVQPVDSRFLLIGAQVDRRPPFLPASRRKRAVLRSSKAACEGLRGIPGVRDATVFRALLAPPGRGAYLRRRPELDLATYDVVALVEFDPALRDDLLQSPPCIALRRALMDPGFHALEVEATNVRRIGPVDHVRDGVFLFNFFVAADRERNLDIWTRTAGWFQQETGLDNSTVLLPLAGEGMPYSIINHCRWDRLRDVLPSLLFTTSFRTFVLAGFEHNDVAAVPVLYRLA